jgi:two-component system sensor kinase FixL
MLLPDETRRAEGASEAGWPLLRAEDCLALTGVMIVALDAWGKVVLINRKACELLGREERDILGRDWFEHFVPARLRDEVRRVFASVLRGDLELAERFENPILAGDGGEVPIEWHNAAIRDAAGRVVGTLSSGTDITRRERAEEGLRRSIATTRAVFDTAVDAIVVINELGIIQSVNQATERLFGYSSEDLSGKNVALLMPPPYRGEHDGYIRRYLETGDKRIIGIGREAEAVTKDGRIFPIDLSVNEVEVDGRRFFAGMIRDITRRKEAEEALRRSEEWNLFLVENAGVVILFLTPDRRILRWNSEAERIYGCSREEAIGKDYVEAFLPEEAREGAAAAIREVLAGSPLRGYEHPVRSNDGSERLLLWNAERLLDKEGSPLGLVACGLDVTEHRRLSRQLVEQASLARLGELAAVVAHEVKNPIAGIGGALRVLKDRAARGGNREVIEETISRLDDLNRLVDDILLFARPRTPRPTPVPIRLVLEDAIHLTKRDPQFSHVDVELSADEDLVVPCDVEMLKPVFLNLLVNAAHAMEGRGRIAVTVAADSACCAAGCCEVAFADTGPGIPAEAREKVFEPFFSTKTRGTGLGLAIARRVVELHGGTITITCPAGGGTRVAVELPVKR